MENTMGGNIESSMGGDRSRAENGMGGSIDGTQGGDLMRCRGCGRELATLAAVGWTRRDCPSCSAAIDALVEFLAARGYIQVELTPRADWSPIPPCSDPCLPNDPANRQLTRIKSRISSPNNAPTPRRGRPTPNPLSW
jgi:hypothetical protein